MSASSPLRRRASAPLVLAAVLLGAAAGVALTRGADRMPFVSLPVVTYVNHAVGGLSAGSPVLARGVPVGSVVDLGLAPDGAHVEIEARLERSHAQALGFEGGDPPAQLRARVARNTGPAGGLVLELVTDDASPPPALAFEPGAGYVPAGPARLDVLALGAGTESAPDPARRFEEFAAAMTAQVENADLVSLSQSTRAAVLNLDQTLTALEPEALSKEVRVTLGEIREAVAAFRELVEKKKDGGGGGLFDTISSVGLVAESIGKAIDDANVGETTASLRGLMDQARGLTGDASGMMKDTRLLMGRLERHLAEVRRALMATTALLHMIERDPGVFLRGRGESSAPQVGGTR